MREGDRLIDCDDCGVADVADNMTLIIEEDVQVCMYCMKVRLEEEKEGGG